jgi:GTPase
LDDAVYGLRGKGSSLRRLTGGTRVLDLVAFGKIAVGKSALLNAIFRTTEFAVDVRGGTTRRVESRVVKFDGVDLRIMDTPGIGEVSGAERGAAASDAAIHADIVLVIFDHEPTGFEFDAVLSLARIGKPLLVILNKADALKPSDRSKLLGQIQKRINGYVNHENVLYCSADPLKHYVREWPDGRVEEWSKRTAPDIERVRDRLREILRSEGHFLEQIDTLSRQVEDRRLLQDTRKRSADELIEKYAIGIGVTLALNPIPLLDLFGGGVAAATLIHQLARNYDVEISQQEVKELAHSLVTDGWQSLWPAVIPLVGASVVKGIPVVGWWMSAISLGVGGFYLTHIIGQACSEYFANNKNWSISLRCTLDNIIKNTDRRAISRRAAELIKARLG